MQSASKSTSNFQKGISALKNIGGTLLSTFTNMAVAMAVSWAVGKVIEGIDNYIHRVEIAIEKGKEAQQAIEDISSSYNNKKDSVENIQDRFIELSGGVDNKTNENIRLTTEEYTEFLNISNQLAELFPELVVGYDAQGNALLSLSGEADSTTNSLGKLLEQERMTADFKISENLQTAFDGAITSIKLLQEEITNTEETIETLEGAKDTFTKSGLSLEDMGFTVSEDGYEYGLELINDQTAQSIELFNAQQHAFVKAMQDVGIDSSQYWEDLTDSAENGINAQKWTGHLYNLTVDQVDAFTEAYSSYIKESSVDVSEDLINAYQLQSGDMKEIQANWNSLVPSLINSMSVYDGYNDLGDEIKQAINSGIGTIDPISEWMDSEGNWNQPENIRAYLREKLLDPFLDVMNSDIPEVKEGFDSLFTLDTSKLTIKQYQDELSKILPKIEQAFAEIYGDSEGEEKYKEFLVTFGFKVVDEDGNLIDSNSMRRYELEELAAANGENTVGLGLNELTVEQLVEVETIYKDASNGQTLQEVIDQVISKAKEAVNSAEPSFSSILSSEDITKQVDDFQSNISTIQDVLDKLKTGEFTDSDITDLKQQFPSLVTETENLESALNNLAVDNFISTMSSIRTAMEGVTDPTQLAAMKSFGEDLKKQLISALDMSDVTADDLLNNFKEVTSLDNWNPTAFQNSFGKLVSEFGGTEEGRAGLITLAAAIELDPSLAYADYETLKAYVEDNKVIADIEFSQSRIEELQSQMTALQDEATKVQDSLSLKEANGVKPLVNDYQKLIKNSNQQVKNLQNQNAELRNQQTALKNLGLDETSAAYQEIESQINANVSAINQARLSQVEWNKTVDSLRYEPNEGLMAYNTAKSTRNAGDNYLDMLAAAKEAQEARQKGLIGTDDFKTVAEMFSPNGMDDATNWDENYGNITRYFTEDVTGVKNALNDLEDANLATQDSMGNWTYSIDDVQKSADTLGVSFEAFLAIMGRLQDYGFSNDFFSSIEEGQEHISDLYTELTNAELEMQRLKKARDDGDTSVTDSVLASQEARVNQIKQSILESQDLLAQLASKDAQTYQAEQNAKIQSVLTMAKTSQQLDEQYVQGYLSNIQDTIEENGLEVDLKDLITINDDGSLAINWEEYLRLENQVGIPLEVTTEFKDAQVEEIKTKLTSAMEDGTSEVQSFVDTIAQYSSEQLGSITFGDGSYGEFEDAERAIDGLLSSLGLSQSEAQTLLTILAEMGKIEYTPEVSTEGVTEGVQNATSEAQTEAENNPVVIHTEIEASGETPTLEGAEGQTATIDITGNNEPAKQSATEAKEFGDSQSANINVGADTSEAYSDVNKLIENVSHRFVDINVGANTFGLITDIDNALSGTRTINVHANVTGLPDSDGVALGTAHANGTVMGLWNNYRVSIGAYAKGNNWALPRNETALVNELGKFMLSINLFNCWKLLRVLQTTT